MKDFTAVSKKQTVQYRKNGNQFIEHWLMDSNDYIKVVSPTGFKRTPVHDYTSSHTTEVALRIDIKKLQFNKQMDFNTAMTRAGVNIKDNPLHARVIFNEMF